MEYFSQYKKEWRNSPVLYSAGTVLLVLSLVVYVDWAWVWYRERMFHFDAAFYLFRIIQMDGFQLFHDRYINLFTQWLPLLTRSGGGDLVEVARAYSLALPLVHLAVAAGLFLWKKEPFLPLLFLLVVLSPVRYRFFSPVSETHFVLIFGFLYFIFTQEGRGGGKSFLIAGVLSILLAAISHPVAVIPILGLWSIALVSKPEKWRIRLIEILFIAALFAWRFVLAVNNPYELGKMSVWTRLGELLEGGNDLVVIGLIGEYMFREHLVQWIIFTITMIWLFLSGKRLITALILLFAAGLLVFVTVTFSYLSFPEYHMMEGYLGFISLAWFLPFYFLGRERQRRTVLTMLIAFSLIASFFSIHEVRNYYEKREQYLKEWYRPWQVKGNKWLVYSPYEFPWRQLWLPWSVPFETLLISASEDKRGAVTIFIPDDLDELKEVQHRSGTFFGAWKEYPLETLDTNYFQLPRQPYLDITGAGLPNDFRE